MPPEENAPGVVTAAPAEVAQESTETAQADINKVADAVADAAKTASEAAQAAPDSAHHEVMARVATVLDAVNTELKRANDMREYEQRQAAAALESASAQVQPVAQLVEEKPIKKVRRGARMVKHA